jgi:hypothetical protein
VDDALPVEVEHDERAVTEVRDVQAPIHRVDRLVVEPRGGAGQGNVCNERERQRRRNRGRSPGDGAHRECEHGDRDRLSRHW